MPVVLSVFGTRPEIIKFAPVIRAVEADPRLTAVNVFTAQHLDLARPFLDLFRVRVDHDLDVMRAGQHPEEVLSRLLSKLGPVLEAERPDIVLVQGDTTSALAGGLSAFYRQIRVGHIEAGLRSGDPMSPFPEEMHRCLLSRLASVHFAATVGNRDTLLSEGVSPDAVVVTGNPVIDSLDWVRRETEPSANMRDLLQRHAGQRLLVLTTHRRESFGADMKNNLQTIVEFIDTHHDTVLISPVHPNPEAGRAVRDALEGRPRVELTSPLSYPDFIHLAGHAWLIVSDSGGVQEEAPSLGVPLLILRENTERPEVVESGAAILIGGNSERLAECLEDAYQRTPPPGPLQPNPFGDGRAGPRIAAELDRVTT